MKTSKFFAAIGVAVGLSVGIGCKSVPTNEAMYTTSYAIGVSAGMIANQTSIDDASRNAVCEILNLVATVIPETNQTFEAAWTPIAKAHIAKLVADGKLNAQQARMVETAFSLAVQGLDYIFEVRYPKANTYKELVTSAVSGFTDGFLLVFKPADGSLKACGNVSFDAEAYEWLKSKSAKRCCKTR